MKYKKLFMLGLILQSYAYCSSNIPQGIVVVGPNAIGMGDGSGMAVTNALTGPVENQSAKTLSAPLDSVALELGSGNSYLAFTFDKGILNKIPSEVIKNGLYVSMNTSNVSSFYWFTDVHEKSPARKLVAALTDKEGNVYAEAFFYAMKNVPPYTGYNGGNEGAYYYNLSQQTITFKDTQGNTATVGPYNITAGKRAWFTGTVAPLGIETLAGSQLTELWFSPVFTQINSGPSAQLACQASNTQKLNTALSSGAGPVRITATYDTINNSYVMTAEQSGTVLFTQSAGMGVQGLAHNAPLANLNISIATNTSNKTVFNYSNIDGIELSTTGGNLIIQGVSNKVSAPLTGTFAAGETLSDVELGFAFTGSGTGKSTDTMVSVPLSSTHVAAINSNIAAGKEVVLDVALNKGAAYYGMTATLTVPGDTSFTPVTISQQPLKGTGTLSSGVSSTTYTAKSKEGVSIGYKTNNQKGMKLYSKSKLSFKQRPNSVVLAGQSGSGSPTTLVGALQALGKNPTQPTVESTIKTYYKGNMTTIKNDWSTISSNLSTAGLSSMTSALKEIFDPVTPSGDGDSGNAGGGRF